LRASARQSEEPVQQMLKATKLHASARAMSAGITLHVWPHPGTAEAMDRAFLLAFDFPESGVCSVAMGSFRHPAHLVQFCGAQGRSAPFKETRGLA